MYLLILMVLHNTKVFSTLNFNFTFYIDVSGESANQFAGIHDNIFSISPLECFKFSENKMHIKLFIAGEICHMRLAHTFKLQVDITSACIVKQH